MVIVSVYGSLILSMKLFKYIFSFTLFCLVFAVDAGPTQDIWWKNFTPLSGLKNNRDKILDEYKKLHKEFFKKSCPARLEHDFWELNRKYRVHGNYIPILLDGSLDEDTVARFVPELIAKEAWIKKQIVFLKKQKTFNNFLHEVKELNKDVERLLTFKENFHDETSKLKKRIILNKSKYLLIQFKNSFKMFFNKIPFLVSYRYPLDHLELRKKYDEYKNIKDNTNKKVANEVYFYRKIVQDGARNKNHSSSDRNLRASIDTVILGLDKSEDFLTENNRYDIIWIFRRLERVLNKGISYSLHRAQEWLERTEGNRKYYQSLVFNENDIRDHFDSDVIKVLEEKAIGRDKLRNFVLDKNAQTYIFWSKQSALMKILFSIETILFNEVGRVDGKWGLERRDVAQIVLNRTLISEYHVFKEDDALYKRILQKRKILVNEIRENKWLNVLFKEGEFSFTYFFISGNLRIYCPDMSRIGRSLRRENLKIALEILESPQFTSRPVRYFSRAGMLGKIDMAKLWSGFTELPEVAGPIIEQSFSLDSAYKNKKYKYNYHFEGENGIKYKVVEIAKKKYVLNLKTQKFYVYRNPHYFRYFTKKSNI